jgi:hypothetical protein
MSDYWFNAAKTAGDSSLRAVAKDDAERIVWVNLVTEEKGHQLALADEIRAAFGTKSVTLDIDKFDIQRGKNGSRSIVTTYVKLLDAIDVADVLVAREMSDNEQASLRAKFGTRAPRATVVADEAPF